MSPTAAEGTGEKEVLINVDEQITKRIEEQLSQIESTSSYGTLCIYKVPEKHRSKNQEAYAPQLVSIGLVHYGEAQLQAMEEYKLKYLSNFLDTFQVPLMKLVEHVNGEEKRVCGCYEDMYVKNVVEKSKVASEVILLDGIFIVQLFLKNYFVKMRENGDMVFDNSTVSNEILHDLLLFENQLPFRFLSKLYEEFVGKKVRNLVLDDDPLLCSPSFNQLVHVYFRDVGNAGKLLLRSIDFQHPRHFVEFLSMLHMPDDKEMRKRMIRETINVGKESHFSKCRNASKLKEVGVKFEQGTTSCLLDISFEDGVLTIPPFTVNSSTETFFRNLIAFEQSGYHFKYTTSFAVLLDNLIDTDKDVDILIQQDIIKNELANPQQVADIFNTLNQEFLADPREFYYVEECRLLNNYSRSRWQKFEAKTSKWISETKVKYFSTPWSFCSLIAALIVLVLTIVQTAYAIKTYKRGH